MLNYNIRGDGYPVIFLHGALVDHYMWENQVSFLENKYKPIAVDLPGHGNSTDVDNNYTIEEISNVILKELIDKFDSCIICGHSLGGMVCQYIAYCRPKKVKAIILAKTSFGTKNNLSEKIQSVFAEFFLSIATSKTIINASANQYGKISEETKEYILNSMSKYNIKMIRRVMFAALNNEGENYERRN